MNAQEAFAAGFWLVLGGILAMVVGSLLLALMLWLTDRL